MPDLRQERREEARLLTHATLHRIQRAPALVLLLATAHLADFATGRLLPESKVGAARWRGAKKLKEGLKPHGYGRGV
jgi:hypothetical protein